MPTVNGPDEITTLTGSADKVFYTDSNGDVKEVSIGTDGQTLVSTGATAPEFDGLTGLKGGVNSVLYTNATGDLTELGLSATAGDVLTSNGAAVAPTWVAAASNAVTLNSSAAIALGAFVVLESAGTVKEVGTSSATGIVIGAPNTSGVGWGARNAINPSANYDPTSDATWCSTSNTSGYLSMYRITVDVNGTCTIGGLSLYSTLGTHVDGEQTSVVDTTNNRMMVVFRASDSYWYGISAPITGTGTGAALGTWSTAHQYSTTYYNWSAVPPASVYVASLDRMYFFFTNANNQLGMVGIAKWSGSAVAFEMGSQPLYTNYNNNNYYNWDCALAANGQIALIHGGNGVWAGTSACNITPAATTVTFQGGDTQIMAGVNYVGTSQGVALVYDTSQSKMVAYQVGNQNSSEVATFEVGTTLAPTSISATYVVDSTTAFTAVSRVRPPLGYDSTNEDVIIGFVTSANNYIKYSALDVSGAAPVLSGVAVDSLMNKANYTQYGGYAFDTAFGWLVAAPLYSTNNSAVAVTNTATTSNYEAWLGVAQNAATGAAEAVDVKTFGSVDENQTGMTIGDVIYLTTTGGITSSSAGNKVLGRALTATKLLIQYSGTGTA